MFSANYIILDAARMGEEIDVAIGINENNKWLYSRKNEEYLRKVSPYLFRINPDFDKWVVQNGWGKSWGIFIESKILFGSLFHHFHKLTTVKIVRREESYFRFFDPRVLRIFLPTCDAFQLKEFFGPVNKIICEDENPSFALLFSFDGKKLITEKVAADIVRGLTMSNSKD